MHPTLTGNIRYHRSFQSRFLKTSRDVIVYLPPDYDASRDSRYPVLYMHDGQNLFDASTAFGGNEWGLDESAEYLIAAGEIQPLIIVGIYNTGVERIAEYTQVKDRRGRGGRARAYAKLLVRELKPFIDREYRTLPDPFNTGTGGSSLGGLVSLYLGLEYPDVFGKLWVMSPSVWWANGAILRKLDSLRPAVRQKIWLDIGTREDANPEATVASVQDVCNTLIKKGWQPGDNLLFRIDEGGGHNEQAWGYRAPMALRFLFPPRT